MLTNKKIQENQNKLTEDLEKISMYLTSNKLTINETKTSLMEFMVHQKRPRLKDKEPEQRTVSNTGEEKTVMQTTGW